MRHSPMFLCLALSALTACSGDPPTSPSAWVPGDTTPAPAVMTLSGILEITNDDPVRYALRLDNESLVLLIWDAGAFANSLIGERVVARGTYTAKGDFAADNVRRANGKQLPY